MPWMHASDRVRRVGSLKEMRFRLIPACAFLRNSSHRRRSARVSDVRRVMRRWDALARAWRRRLRKCRAIGMMNPAWFSRPIVVSRDLHVAVGWASSSLIARDHAVYLSPGRAISRRRVSMVHPRISLRSAGVASPRNFFSDSRSAR